MKKKVLTLFLAICLAAGNVAVPVSAFAAEVKTGQVNASDWEWEEQEGGGVSVTAYKGTETEVTIPGTLDGKTVTAIGARAFSSQGEGGSTVTKVTIPNSVTAIGDSAFSGCENLEEVNIPSGVTEISYSTFSLCFKLKNVTLPSGVTTIGNSAFFACQSLESIALPENLATIGEEAFAGCSGTGEDDVVTGLGSITIPASVTLIGKNAFAENENLRQITVAEGNDNYASVEGVLFNQAKAELIAYPAGREGAKYEVPSGVQKIRDGAFYGVHTLSEVTFPST